MAELTAGAVVAHRPTGRLLLIHQAADDRWCLPKGHVEAGESVLDAARREVAEETGLDGVEYGDELCQVEYRYYDPRADRNVFKSTVYFLAFAPTGPLHLEPGFDRGEWLSASDGRARVRYATDRTALDAAARALGSPREDTG